MVGKVNCLMYLTLFQHKCPISKFQTIITIIIQMVAQNLLLLLAGHADGIFVDGWLCWVQFRSHCSDIGHMILIAVT